MCLTQQTQTSLRRLQDVAETLGCLMTKPGMMSRPSQCLEGEVGFTT